MKLKLTCTLEGLESALGMSEINMKIMSISINPNTFDVDFEIESECTVVTPT